MDKSELIGNWIPDPNDEITKKLFGSVRIEFRNNGILIYRINEGDKEQFIKLTYEIIGDKLITDQPSHPRKEVTNFEKVDNKLLLYFEGNKCLFIRE